jgi:hypothetical protein
MTAPSRCTVKEATAAPSRAAIQRAGFDNAHYVIGGLTRGLRVFIKANSAIPPGESLAPPPTVLLWSNDHREAVSAGLFTQTRELNRLPRGHRTPLLPPLQRSSRRLGFDLIVPRGAPERAENNLSRKRCRTALRPTSRWSPAL